MTNGLLCYSSVHAKPKLPEYSDAIDKESPLSRIATSWRLDSPESAKRKEKNDGNLFPTLHGTQVSTGWMAKSLVDIKHTAQACVRYANPARKHGPSHSPHSITN